MDPKISGLTAAGVALAHHVVQQQDGILARLGLHIFQLRQLEGQNGRPLLPLGAVFF